MQIKKIIFIVVITLVIIIVAIYQISANQKEEEYDYLEITQNAELQNTEQEENIEIQEQIKQEETIFVHVTGQVNNAGIVEVKEGARIIDVINAAGGMTDKADETKINLAYKIEDGQKIYVPSKEDREEIPYITSESGKNIIEEKTSKKETVRNVMININTADVKGLQELPGIGESTANKIVEYRKTNGKFKTIEDIKNVKGIGESKYEKIKNNICV